MILDILFISGLTPLERVMLFVAVVAALIFALTLHEFAHAYVALLNGDRTAKMNGRVSLNPMRHLDPIGFFMLMAAGFGYAKPVPVNPYNFKKRRFGLFTVSIAGVTTNFLLAFFSSGIYMALAVFTSLNTKSAFLLLFLDYFQYFNLGLCFFNLLPFFPLDGFNVLTTFFRPGNKFIIFMRNYGFYILFTLVGLSFIVNYYDNLPVSWWKYFDVLGLYFKYTAGKVSYGLFWLWGEIFGL